LGGQEGHTGEWLVKGKGNNPESAGFLQCRTKTIATRVYTLLFNEGQYFSEDGPKKTLGHDPDVEVLHRRPRRTRETRVVKGGLRRRVGGLDFCGKERTG